MKNPWKLSTFVLAAMLAVSTAAADRQPVMRDALASLKSAERSLAHAAHDKGGHRVKALDLTRSAIREVEAGIRFDNRR